MLHLDGKMDITKNFRAAIKYGRVEILKVMIRDPRGAALVNDDAIALAESFGHPEIVAILKQPITSPKIRRKRSRSPSPSTAPSSQQPGLPPPLIHVTKAIEREHEHERGDEDEGRDTPTASPIGSPAEVFNILKQFETSDEAVNYVEKHGKHIGKGTEADVYLIGDSACKVFLTRTGDTNKKRNIKFLRAHYHSGVVPKFHYLENTTWRVLCMEYLPGYITIEKYLSKTRPKPSQEERQNLYDAVIAARSALSHDITYRDLTNLGNIMMKKTESNGDISIKFLEGGYEKSDKDALRTFSLLIQDKLGLGIHNTPGRKTRSRSNK
jgi:hypothetical protein